MASAASIASLSSAVETAIVRRESVGARRGLEEVLRVNKPALIALLKNPVRLCISTFQLVFNFSSSCHYCHSESAEIFSRVFSRFTRHGAPPTQTSSARRRPMGSTFRAGQTQMLATRGASSSDYPPRQKLYFGCGQVHLVLYSDGLEVEFCSCLCIADYLSPHLNNAQW